jgi:hypothetical protein
LRTLNMIMSARSALQSDEGGVEGQLYPSSRIRSSNLGPSSFQGTAFSISPDRFLTCRHVIENTGLNRLKLASSINPDRGALLILHDVSDLRSDPRLDIIVLMTHQPRGELVSITPESRQPLVGLDNLAGRSTMFGHSIGISFSSISSSVFSAGEGEKIT